MEHKLFVKAFAEILDKVARRTAPELLETVIKKSSDYNPKNNALKTFQDAASFAGIDSPVQVVVSRMVDKFNRIKNLLNTEIPPSVTNESLQDSLKDLAGYALIATVILKEEDKANQEYFNSEEFEKEAIDAGAKE